MYALTRPTRFAYEERMVLMSDEVYQELVYVEGRPFISARKVQRGGEE